MNKITAVTIRRWMENNSMRFFCLETGELNLTAMVEAWDHAMSEGGSTTDPNHEAWEIAAELNANLENRSAFVRAIRRGWK